MSAPLSGGLSWTLWREMALSISAVFAKPKNLRVVLEDGTVVPCTCVFSRLDESGFSIWTVVANQAAAVLAGRVRSFEAGEIPPLCGGFDLPQLLMPSISPAP